MKSPLKCRWNDHMKLTGFLWPWLRGFIAAGKSDSRLRENIILAVCFVMTIAAVELADRYQAGLYEVRAMHSGTVKG